MLLLAFRGVVDDVERVLGRTGRMVFRRIECREVVVGRLDERAVLDGIAHTAEDVLDLLADLRDQMLGAKRLHAAWQRDIGRLGCEAGLQDFLRDLDLALLDGSHDLRTHVVCHLAHDRALLIIELAHLVHDLGQAALPAENLDTQLLQRFRRERLGNAFAHLILNRCEVIVH